MFQVLRNLTYNKDPLFLRYVLLGKNGFFIDQQSFTRASYSVELMRKLETAFPYFLIIEAHT
jgi:hypothetical protein